MSTSGIGFPEPGGEMFTGGHSGTDTSQEAAVEEVESGRKSYREEKALDLLDREVEYGVTVAELRYFYGWHHGRASSTLSTLHKAGKIARLNERRGRCKVYVLPENVNGRETEPYERQKHALTASETAAVARMRRYLGYGTGKYVAVPVTDLRTILEALQPQGENDE